jgi:hypothetical protein
MSALDVACELAETHGISSDEALGTRARAEGVCPDCLMAVAVAYGDTADEATGFLIGVIVGATLTNSKVEE